MTACERPACVGVMSGDPQSKQEFADIAAQLAAAEQAALPLFGLTAKFSGPRSLNGVGRRGDVVDHVSLSHGRLTEKRVDVSVAGPLHGPVPGGEWAIDPLPMIAGELLDHAGVELASGAELERGAEDVGTAITGRRCTTSSPTTSSTSWRATQRRPTSSWSASTTLPRTHSHSPEARSVRRAARTAYGGVVDRTGA